MQRTSEEEAVVVETRPMYGLLFLQDFLRLNFFWSKGGLQHADTNSA